MLRQRNYLCYPSNDTDLRKVGEKSFRKYTRIVLIGLFLSTIFFVYKAMSVDVDYDFEKFYPTSDPETEFFMNYRTKFRSDNDFLLISIERSNGVFDIDFLKKVNEFTEELKEQKYVDSVVSLTNQKEYSIRTITTSRDYIDFENVDLKRDSAGIFKNTELVNTFIAEDASSVCVFLQHEEFLSKDKSDELITGIFKCSEKYDFEKVRMAGRTIGQRYYIDKMMSEMLLFVGLSAVLVVLFLAIAFKSIWGVLVPQAVIFSGMVWLIGGMGVFNEPINIILTVLPSVMFVVSMSDVIHLVSRYLDALRVEEKPFVAIKVAVREVGIATLLTSITTAIGFFSLVFVRVQPIQVFGVVMGIGVLIAFVLTFVTLPALFYIFPGPKYVRNKKDDHFWKKRLAKWFVIVMNRKWRVIGISVVLIIISVVGLLRIKPDNLLMDDLHDKEPLKADFNYLDEHYGGVRPFELAVQLHGDSTTLWDDDVMKTLDSVEMYLREDYGLNIKTSIISTVKIMNRSMYSGLPEFNKLPHKKSKKRDIKRAITSERFEPLLRTMVDSTDKLLRIGGTIPDLGNQTVTAMDKKLNRFLESKTLGGKIEYQITGTAHLIDKNLSYLSVSLVQGLAVSILIVALIMGLIYRSGSILLISIVPNIVPLLFIGGVMGFVGVDLKISTAIIFTIAFGIAVDDTIHLLGKFKYELMKGRSKMYALKRSYMTTGKAMILTTLILCSGFALLIFSSFMGTFYLGIMLCLALFVALIADLTLLPVLILLFYHPKKKSKS
jgi:predicted RND superfamily exporter protein